MGGRGASSPSLIYEERNADGTFKVDENGNHIYHEYGDELTSVATFSTKRGEVKVVYSNDQQNLARPYETRTPGRIYAMLDRDNNINRLYFFNQDGKLKEEWNIGHSHFESKYHVHTGYEHSVDTGRPMTDTEIAYYEKVNERWKSKNIQVEKR